ncbi:MAG: hypothetical protein A3B86_02815 [Candidatus Yanofskybacteria bacterium RIFCSPHIGHO2_02_FULL_38_22b]|uniref:Uncharacterized protein n=1 Tax=Candidatus Yanofskybacteria bacterium RIFCSPHIGHO2_02_FULL_38_22b TaxID=1802673 RepID=A0A1F8F0Y9_9BACT|nr:MAG: hypothetical protein A2816_02405 [Candidatus Yanofskybacteria bacterium RIFCSPHIGHO2_01_FULL_39_44]OGN06804.1 MAG: hypothetical protein A3B86_02815 [Candidatus Yanofskybacteria bacterium RIFCSPHIGHO2_02_FULL_38_22b]OGN20699.1 MAG: hypothetical protein A2910_00775 [Candidatus Yanofskybacteria bacterium RIFCSPLOWO2_01_FULL_39_28]
MNNSFVKVAKILRISQGDLMNLDQQMTSITGQASVIDAIVAENNALVEKTLVELGLPKDSLAEEIYGALINKLSHIDKHLFELLDKPDLGNMSSTCGKMCEVAFQVFAPPKGLFIKNEKVTELLNKYKPDNLLKHFGYSSVGELVEKEGFASVVSALRFAQDQEWMHKFFDEAYSDLKPTDFEERDVELIVLDKKWVEVAEKYLEKKYHNVSHLKEFGVIFITPIKIDIPGETSRMFTLILHYLHEVPFYSALFRRYIGDSDFNIKFKSLLRGDVPSGQIMEGGQVIWRIVQRYLAKDNENDPRLFQPHVNPEAEHWFRAEGDFQRLSRMLKKDDGGVSLSCWTGLDFVGDFFKDRNGEEVLVSFNFIDLTMSLVKKGHIKYLYHHQEALWNKIFSEYMGRETMNRLIDENIIRGFIEL